jgi:hypothetical protein
VLESRWVRWVGPGVIVVLALGALATATATSGAGARTWTPPPCPATTSIGKVATAAAPAGLPEIAAQAWFRLDPLLDPSGALEGQQLSLGIDGERGVMTMRLPSESFATGPFGGLILVGRDDGSTSVVQAVDAAAGCAWTLANEAAVIRRATIDPAATTLYETRVDRASRADLGVWAAGLDGAAAKQVLGPVSTDERFGRTFTTEFAWDPDGEVLAVQSCGEAACRTRLVGRAGGPARVLDDPDLGTMIGIADDRLVGYLACPGLPCPIVSVDLRSHGRVTLAEDAGIGILAVTPDGVRVVHEVFTPSGLALGSVALDGSGVVDLGPIADGLRLHPSPDRAEAATRLPEGWALLTPDGRIAVDGLADRGQLRHVPDGATVQFEEVVR